MRKLNELTQNYQKLRGNYNELTANYITKKKEIDYQQGQRGNEEYNFETEEHSRRNQKET